LSGWMMGKDRDDRAAAMEAMTSGMGTQTWINPDTGMSSAPLGVRRPAQDLGPQEGPRGIPRPPRPQALGDDVQFAPAGGIPGAIAATQGLGDNPYAQRNLQGLLMQQGAAQAETARVAEQRAYTEELAKAERARVAAALTETRAYEESQKPRATGEDRNGVLRYLDDGAAVFDATVVGEAEPDAPEHYQWNASGVLEPISGGKEDPANPKNRFNRAKPLRTEYVRLSSDYIKVRDGNNSVQSAGANMAGDLSLLVAFMKVIDPRTGVREGELATAMATGSVPQRLEGAVMQVLSGERLTDDQRDAFKGEAQQLFDARAGQHQQLIANYTGLAERAGLNPANVVLDFGQVFATENDAPLLPPDLASISTMTASQIAAVDQATLSIEMVRAMLARLKELDSNDSP
jgi:hypothetical protein